jgi:hypothetical protein
MRKILPLLLLLFLLVGCSNVSNCNNPKENDIMQDIYFTEIDWCSIEWNQIQCSIDLNEDVLKEIEPIDTHRIAVDIGTKIIEELHRDGKLSEYTLISITHSTEDNVWCFEYSIDQQNVDIDNLIDCGCLYVAIDGNNGVLIKAWLEE